MNRPPKIWILAEYWATSKTLEVAQNAMLEAGAIGIEVDDGVGPENQRAYEADNIRLLAYFEPCEHLNEHVTAHVAEFFAQCGFEPAAINFCEFAEDDWQGNFVRSCTTFVVEPNIYIVPSFEIDEFRREPRGDLFIEMDPENAFGTGQHQTTKLCLKNICEYLDSIPINQRTQVRALDIGTGSAILAILLKKLGVGHVQATDIDSDALDTARKNALRNGVALNLTPVTEDYIYQISSYELVVANILAPTLIIMADNLINACVTKGTIILSGILVTQAPDVIAAYQHRNMRLLRQENMDDWCALVLVKN